MTTTIDQKYILESEKNNIRYSSSTDKQNNTLCIATDLSDGSEYSTNKKGYIPVCRNCAKYIYGNTARSGCKCEFLAVRMIPAHKYLIMNKLYHDLNTRKNMIKYD
jgi:hypothetical protein